MHQQKCANLLFCCCWDSEATSEPPPSFYEPQDPNTLDRPTATNLPTICCRILHVHKIIRFLTALGIYWGFQGFLLIDYQGLDEIQGLESIGKFVAVGLKTSIERSCCNLDDAFIQDLCTHLTGNSTLEESHLKNP